MTAITSEDSKSSDIHTIFALGSMSYRTTTSHITTMGTKLLIHQTLGNKISPIYIRSHGKDFKEERISVDIKLSLLPFPNGFKNTASMAARMRFHLSAEGYINRPQTIDRLKVSSRWEVPMYFYLFVHL